jgi:CBS domain-containing protein
MQCSDMMKAQPECIGPTVVVSDAAQRMLDKNIGFLPVCDSTGVAIGTITDRDLAVRVVAKSLPASTRVGDVMTKEVVTCRTTDELERAKMLMARHQKSRIMCVDEMGRLVGVISLSDIARDSDASDTLSRVAVRESHA